MEFAPQLFRLFGHLRLSWSSWRRCSCRSRSGRSGRSCCRGRCRRPFRTLQCQSQRIRVQTVKRPVLKHQIHMTSLGFRTWLCIWLTQQMRPIDQAGTIEITFCSEASPLIYNALQKSLRKHHLGCQLMFCQISLLTWAMELCTAAPRHASFSQIRTTQRAHPCICFISLHIAQFLTLTKQALSNFQPVWFSQGWNTLAHGLGITSKNCTVSFAETVEKLTWLLQVYVLRSGGMGQQEWRAKSVPEIPVPNVQREWKTFGDFMDCWVLWHRKIIKVRHWI